MSTGNINNATGAGRVWVSLDPSANATSSHEANPPSGQSLSPAKPDAFGGNSSPSGGVPAPSAGSSPIAGHVVTGQPSLPGVIGPENNGQTISAKVDEALSINLPSNPSTGYQWVCISNSRGLPVKGEEFRADVPMRAGSGGAQCFDISPDDFAAGGSHDFKFALVRPGEGETADTEYFSVSVQVEE